jgi:hypothetical protein
VQPEVRDYLCGAADHACDPFTGPSLATHERGSVTGLNDAPHVSTRS